MAQIEVTGLAEVLADHEDKIAAAQAWCVRKNIGSIEELREKGAAAVDEFWIRPQGFRDRADFEPYYEYDARLGRLVVGRWG